MNSACDKSNVRWVVVAIFTGALGCSLAARSMADSTTAPGAHAMQKGTRHAFRPRGDYTRHTEVRRTEHGHESRTTWTDAQGRTATRSATVTNDRANGTRTESVDWVGPNGKTASRDTVTTRVDDGYTRNSTWTNARGEQGTRDVTATYNRATGTWSKDVKVDRPDGNARSRD